MRGRLEQLVGSILPKEPPVGMAVEPPATWHTLSRSSAFLKTNKVLCAPAEADHCNTLIGVTLPKFFTIEGLGISKGRESTGFLSYSTDIRPIKYPAKCWGASASAARLLGIIHSNCPPLRTVR